MKKLLFVLALVLSLPIVAGAKGKTHIKTPADQECSECHVDQDRVWQEGKHGLMGVKCVVCHGSIDENFTVKPGTAKCVGCHASVVNDKDHGLKAEVQKKKTPPAKGCFTCHDPHLVGLKSVEKGGK